MKTTIYSPAINDSWTVAAFTADGECTCGCARAPNCADQVENSEAFLAKVEYLYEHHDEKSHTEVQLKDGRIIDRYSAPVTGADGKYQGRVWYFRDITDRKQAADEIERLAFYDPLTSLPNRRLLHDRLKHTLETSANHNNYSAVLFIDIDNFKTPVSYTHLRAHE